MPDQTALRRREVVAHLMHDRGDLLAVSGLGSPTYDLAAARDHALNFYLWGAMGSAATVGLGLALAQPSRRVLVITGDGEMLMGLGALATIGAKKPANLAIAVLDNEHYGETGMQQTHTAMGVDLAAIARASGFRQAMTVAEASELDAARAMLRSSEGPIFAAFKVSTARDPLVLPPWDGQALKLRFRSALLGDAAALR